GTVPQTPLDKARLEEQLARAEQERARARSLLQGKGVPPEHERLFADWSAANPGKSYLDFWREQILPTTRGAQAHPQISWSTDKNGNRYATIMRQGPNGELIPETRNLGPIGRPMREAAGLSPRETVSTDERITPRKEIKDT